MDTAAWKTAGIGRTALGAGSQAAEEYRARVRKLSHELLGKLSELELRQRGVTHPQLQAAIGEWSTKMNPGLQLRSLRQLLKDIDAIAEIAAHGQTEYDERTVGAMCVMLGMTLGVAYDFDAVDTAYDFFKGMLEGLEHWGEECPLP